jgi:hypothetical protein
MSDTLRHLLNLRGDLLRQVAQLGDFQPGSVSRVHRRCGKSNCHCAKPTDAGHGPQLQLTQKVSGKTVTQTLSSLAAVHKAEKEIAAFRRFQALTHDLVEVNQKICRLRPVEAQEQSAQEKKTAEAIQQEITSEIEHLLELIFCEHRNQRGRDLEALEMAIRSSHMQASMMPGDFVKNQIGHSSLRIASNYTHFEHKQKREMAERLLSCTQTGSLYSVAEHAKAS